MFRAARISSLSEHGKPAAGLTALIGQARRSTSFDAVTKNPSKAGVLFGWARLVSNQRPLACEATRRWRLARLPAWKSARIRWSER
jgi:hypothetical protein